MRKEDRYKIYLVSRKNFLGSVVDQFDKSFGKNSIRARRVFKDQLKMILSDALMEIGMKKLVETFPEFQSRGVSTKQFWEKDTDEKLKKLAFLFREGKFFKESKSSRRKKPKPDTAKKDEEILKPIEKKAKEEDRSLQEERMPGLLEEVTPEENETEKKKKELSKEAPIEAIEIGIEEEEDLF